MSIRIAAVVACDWIEAGQKCGATVDVSVDTRGEIIPSTLKGDWAGNALYSLCPKHAQIYRDLPRGPADKNDRF